MKKIAKILFIITVLVFSLNVNVYAQSENEIFQAVVRIEAYFTDENGEEMVGLGSGTIISEYGYILTNYHVIETIPGSGEISDEIYICFTFEEKGIPVCDEQAIMVAYDVDYDLALLIPYARLNYETLEYEEIELKDWVYYPTVIFSNSSIDDNEVPHIRDEVWILGFPDAPGTYQINATKGVITGYDSYYIESLDEELVFDLLTDAIINEGNSGGAAFNQYDEFIGVPYAGISAEGGSYGYVIPLHIVNLWLEELVDNEVLEWNPVLYSEGDKMTEQEKQIKDLESKQDKITKNQEKTINDLYKSIEEVQGKMENQIYLIWAGMGVLFVLVIFLFVQKRSNNLNNH